MEKKKVLLPIDITKDNNKEFAFAIEFAKRTNSEILILAAYNFPYGYLLSAEQHKKAIEEEKEKLYLSILELKGYYQCWFNQWKPFKYDKIRYIVKEGSIEEAITSTIKEEKNIILLLHQFYYKKNGVSDATIVELFSSKISILALPGLKDFFETIPNLNSEIFESQKESILDKMLRDSEIYNMPEDINLFRRDILLAS